MMIVSELAIHPLRNLPGLNIQFHQIQKIAKELIEGFTFMSLYRIFHRNIGMDSILLNNELTPKIIDFGFAVLHSTDCNSNKISSITLAQGKDEFLAPERREFISKIKTGYKAETYNIEKSDVFSLGCVLFMLFTGFQYEIKSDSSEKDEWAKFYSSKIEKKEIRKLVYKMLNPNPKVRPFFKQVLEEYLMINFNDNSY
jgi:serine/threonine protein kinase